MADTKISALVAATEVFAANETIIVQGGANRRAAKSLFLTGATGEDTVLTGSSGQFVGLVTDSTAGALFFNDGGQLTITCVDMTMTGGPTPAAILTMTNVGSWVMQYEDGEQILLTNAAGTKRIRLGTSGGAGSAWIDADGIAITYVPGTAGDWNGAAPTDLAIAVDRCATLLKALNGGVGP